TAFGAALSARCLHEQNSIPHQKQKCRSGLTERHWPFWAAFLFTVPAAYSPLLNFKTMLARELRHDLGKKRLTCVWIGNSPSAKDFTAGVEDNSQIWKPHLRRVINYSRQIRHFFLFGMTQGTALHGLAHMGAPPSCPNATAFTPSATATC
ncbi:hypothetical protein, partial [Dyella jejuensis]